MSIKPLPMDTRRLIGSTSLIASPVCLVCELVDNAIDARASCVDVFISRNTVDRVEVRDNGCGISSADFEALGRPSHSSKNKTSGTDASGPPSLGFRGQGLASANNIGYVAVTTRTNDEAVASTFRLIPNVGGVASGSQKVVSAPVGTTVNVTCVFSALPVRRRVAVQESAKTIAAIKALLSSYALARPNLRLSMKILRPQGQGVLSPAEARIAAPWDYRPTTTGIGNCASMKQSISALFGAEVARQCLETVASAKELLGGQLTLSQTLSQPLSGATDHGRHADDGILGDFVFEAWLPQPGADIAKIRQGSFISVDGRPISSDLHGSAGKKICTIFTTAFGKTLAMLQQKEGQQPFPQSKLHGLFIRLNIKCPPGSYDANVDASKTDVLFADEKFLCDAFERLCSRVYRASESMTSAWLFGRSRPIPRTPQRPQMASPLSMSARQGPSRPLFARPIDGTPTPSSRVQSDDTSDSPIRIQICARNRRSLVSVPRTRTVLSPRTPPESPLEVSRGRINRLNRMPNDTDRPSLVPSDGLRQTTISFHGPRARSGLQRQEDGVHHNETNKSHMAGEQAPTVYGTAWETGRIGAGAGIRTATRVPSFVSARELCATEQQARAGPSSPRLVSSLEQGAVRPHGLLSRAAQPKTKATMHDHDGQSTQPSGEAHRPLRVMRVDLQQLQRSAARFTRTMRAWDADEKQRGGDYLSPEMADIAGIEERLRAAIAGWIAKGRSARRGIDGTDGEPLQVELYLRKSLKKKALLVRSGHE